MINRLNSYRELIKIDKSVNKVYLKMSNVKRFKDKIGPGRRPNNIPKQQLEAERLYLEGYDKQRIAQIIRISLMTLYRWANKGNWEENYRKRYQEELSTLVDAQDRIRFYGSKRKPRRLKNQNSQKSSL